MDFLIEFAIKLVIGIICFIIYARWFCDDE